MLPFKTPFAYTVGDQVWVQVRPLSSATTSGFSRLNPNTPLRTAIKLSSDLDDKRVYWPGEVCILYEQQPTVVSVTLHGVATIVQVDTSAVATIVPMCWFGFHIGAYGAQGLCPNHHHQPTTTSSSSSAACPSSSPSSSCISDSFGQYNYHVEPLWYDHTANPYHHEDVHKLLQIQGRIAQPIESISSLEDWPVVGVPNDGDDGGSCFASGEAASQVATYVMGCVWRGNPATGTMPANQQQEGEEDNNNVITSSVHIGLFGRELTRFGKLLTEIHLPYHFGPVGHANPPPPDVSVAEARHRAMLNKMYIGNRGLLTRQIFGCESDFRRFRNALHKSFHGMLVDVHKGCKGVGRLQDEMECVEQAILLARASLHHRPSTSSSSSSATAAAYPPPPSLPPQQRQERRQEQQQHPTPVVISDANIKAYLGALSPEDAAAIREAMGLPPPGEDGTQPAPPPRRTRAQTTTTTTATTGVRGSTTTTAPPPIITPRTTPLAHLPIVDTVPRQATTRTTTTTTGVAPIPTHTTNNNNTHPAPASNFGRQLIPPLVSPTTTARTTPTTPTAPTITNNNNTNCFLTQDVDPWEVESLRILRHDLFDLANEKSRDLLNPTYLFQGIIGAVTLTPDNVRIDYDEEDENGQPFVGLFDNEIRVRFDDLPSVLAYEHHTHITPAAYPSSRAASSGRGNRKVLLVPLTMDNKVCGWPEPMQVSETQFLQTDVAFLDPVSSSNAGSRNTVSPLVVPTNWRIRAAHEASTTARTIIALDVDAQIRAAAVRSVAGRSTTTMRGGSSKVAVDMVFTTRNAPSYMSHWSGTLALIEVDVVPMAQILDQVISRPMSSYSASANASLLNQRKRGEKSQRDGGGGTAAKEEEDEEDGVTVGDTTVQLSCPLSAAIMKLPVRGRSCQHLQCVELEFLLVSCSGTHIWRCPVCLGPVPYSEITVDLPLLEFLRSNRPRIDKLQREGSGTAPPTATFSSGGGRGGYHVTTTNTPSTSHLLGGGSSQLLARRSSTAAASSSSAAPSLPVRTTSTTTSNSAQGGVKMEVADGISFQGSSDRVSQVSQDIVDCDED